MAATPALEQALEYVAGGLCVIPIRADGSKAPALSGWDEYKIRPATQEEVAGWFGNGRLVGPAIVCGRVSQNTFVLDFEFPDVFQEFAELIELEQPGLIGNMPQVVTPGKTGQPGRHLYGQSAEPLKSGKLARITAEDAKARTGDPGKTTAIEVKAEGGYVLAPGCPAACHESGRLYQHVGGPFIWEAPPLSPQEVDILLNCARALDRSNPVTEQYQGAPRPSAAALPGDEERPGTIFNRRATWDSILVPAGWQLVRVKTGIAYWRRPGKQKGISATTGYCSSPVGGDLLCVFSSNASPLDIPAGQDHACFSKFGAFAILDHGGNFSKAASALAARGFNTDVNASKLESEAQFVVAELPLTSTREEMESLADGRLREVVRQRGLTVTEGEIKGAARRAVEHRIEDNPKRLAQEVQKEIEDAASSPDPKWKLVVVTSKPPGYWLKSPFWSGKLKLEPTLGFIFLETAMLLKTWANIFVAALEQAETSIPEKMHGWRRLLERLLQQADHREALLEEDRTKLLVQFICDKMRDAQPPYPDHKGAMKLGYGRPVRLEADKKTLVKITHLLQHAKAESIDRLNWAELSKIMSDMGMEPEKHENSRWWAISDADLNKWQAGSGAPRAQGCAFFSVKRTDATSNPESRCD